MYKGGFDVYQYWVGMYHIATNKKLPVDINVNNAAKLSFNSRIKIIKDQYGFNSEDIKGLIAYTYKHNPLHLDNIANYGKISNLIKTAPDYWIWRKNNRDLINKVGLHKAINLTIPKNTKTDQLLFDLMSQFKETFNELS